MVVSFAADRRQAAAGARISEITWAVAVARPSTPSQNGPDRPLIAPPLLLLHLSVDVCASGQIRKQRGRRLERI